MFINNSRHMTKMAVMPKYGIKKIFFSGTAERIAMKLDMRVLHCVYKSRTCDDIDKF